jgi:hypothetical protein
MATFSNSEGFQKPGRRAVLRAFAGLPLAFKVRDRDAEKKTEPTYRFSTPHGQVDMAVQYFDSSSMDGFRFKDRVTGRSVCLSADGDEHGDCLKRFVGSVAIAQYNFRPWPPSRAAFTLRERVVTIDHDRRTGDRAVFERTMPGEGATISDIQAFGYNPDDAEQAASNGKPHAPWSLLRQELYLNEDTTEFLIVHWKHTVDLIRLMDVIPGDGVRVIG